MGRSHSMATPDKIIDGPLERQSGPQEIGSQNRAVPKHAGRTISPTSLDLHGRDWLSTDTYGIIPGRGSSIRSELSPDNDDNDEPIHSM